MTRARATPLPTEVARGGSSPGPSLSLATALAMLAACLPLSILFTDWDWLPSVVLTIAAVVLTGALLRRTTIPLALIPLTQVAAFLGLQLVITEPIAGSTNAGWAARFFDYRDTLAQGVVAVRDTVAPAATTPGLIALVALLIFLAVLIVETLAVGLGQAGLAGLVFLAAAVIPLGIYPAGANVAILIAPGAGWLLLLAADQSSRVRAWRPLRPANTVRAPVLPVVLISVVTLATAAALTTLVYSSLGGTPWLRSFANSLGADDNGASLDPLVSVANQLAAGQPRDVLRYRSTTGQPQYLGLVTLESFDGTRWQPYAPSPGAPVDTPRRQPELVAAASTNELRIRVGELNNNSLPIPSYSRSIDLPPQAAGRWFWDLRTPDAISPDQVASDLEYQVEAADFVPSAQTLSGVRSTSAQAGLATLSLPAGLPPEVLNLAQEVTEGSADNYQRALALQEWFTSTGGFTYSLDVPEPGGVDPLLAFLTNRVGFCQQFATAMAIMSRSLAIPARVVVGFTGGIAEPDGTFLVTSAQAHAWPELWFDGIGWVRFEPTPASGSAALVSPPYAPAPGLPPGTEQPAEQPAEPATPEQPLEQPSVDPIGPTPSGDAGPRVWLIAAAIGLLLVLAVTPWSLRGHRRTQRLNLFALGDYQSLWVEVCDSAVDAGLDRPTDTTIRAWTDSLVAAADLTPSAETAARNIATWYESSLFAGAAPVRVAGALAAGALPGAAEWPTPSEVNELEARQLLTELDQRPRTWLRRALPTSLVR